jgi:hypothetical protein
MLSPSNLAVLISEVIPPSSTKKPPNSWKPPSGSDRVNLSDRILYRPLTGPRLNLILELAFSAEGKGEALKVSMGGKKQRR